MVAERAPLDRHAKPKDLFDDEEEEAAAPPSSPLSELRGEIEKQFGLLRAAKDARQERINALELRLANVKEALCDPHERLSAKQPVRESRPIRHSLRYAPLR